MKTCIKSIINDIILIVILVPHQYSVGHVNMNDSVMMRGSEFCLALNDTQLTRFVVRGHWVLLATVYYIKRRRIQLIWYELYNIQSIEEQ